MALKFLTVELITARLGQQAAAELSGQTVGTTAYVAWATTQGELVEGLALGYVARRYDINALDFSGQDVALNVFRAHLLDLVYAEIRGARFALSQADKERRDRALEYFREISDGKIAIPTTSEPAATAVPASQATVEGPEREYTSESMEGL